MGASFKMTDIMNAAEGTLEAGELTIAASVDNIPAIYEFVEKRLESVDCPAKVRRQIDIAIDEIFSNIAYYAYGEGTGDATVRVETFQDPCSVELTFIDGGEPFDPLNVAEPDVGLSPMVRDIGGLGILLVKKTMDDVCYERRGDKNVLRIRKNM